MYCAVVVDNLSALSQAYRILESEQEMVVHGIKSKGSGGRRGCLNDETGTYTDAREAPHGERRE